MLLCVSRIERLYSSVTLYCVFLFKDLIKDLKSELGGHFEDTVVALMNPPAEYDASLLRKAIKVHTVCMNIGCSLHNTTQGMQKIH